MIKYFNICLFFFITMMSSAQTEAHIIKTQCNINDLFKSEGLIFESIKYEYILSSQHSVGLGVGWLLKTSKIELNESAKATTQKDLSFTIDYAFYPFKKHNNSGIFLSPELYYSNGMNNVDSKKSQGYGLNVGLGYRLFFKPVILDCILNSGYRYLYEKNSTYTYKSKEIVSLNFKVVIGFIL